LPGFLLFGHGPAAQRMPSTYNGIGTHYYGRKQEEIRQAPCPHCGRHVALVSYDTRLWFVLVFIPVIPLGRKRIIDQCPACTRHYAMDLDKWETSKQLEISGALDKFRSHPTPEAAIETHQALVQFHQLTEAAEFRRTMREKFPDNAKIHAYLGLSLERLGYLEEAGWALRKALELRPDLPEARVGMAREHLRAKKLDEARALLDFLEKPGAQQLYSLEPLEALALAFQQEGRHAEALDVFSKLVTALPALGDHTGFRKNIERSEKVIRPPTSILPVRKFSWKRLFRDPTAVGGGASWPLTWRGLATVGIIVALGLLAAIVWNEYVRRHRTLRVLNALPQPAVVEIQGVGQVQAHTGVSEITLPEGRYHARIRGSASEELDFEIRTGFLDRWATDPVWVINVGGAAILTKTVATYSREAPPPSFTFHFGRTFEFFPEITHPFRPLPESIRMKSHESRTLTQLEVHPGEPIEVFQHLLEHGGAYEALRLAEVCLRARPDDYDMLHAYLRAAQRRQRIDQAAQFLRPRLAERPVVIEWHRAYQDLGRNRAQETRLAAEYDAMLAAEPGNSALLYLRGRVSTTEDEGERFFARSSAADPTNAYPFYAQGYSRMVHGQWAEARALLQKAVALRPKDPTFVHYLRVTRSALGDYDGLEQELRQELQPDPARFSVALDLCEVLAAAGKTNELTQAVNAYERACLARYQNESRELTKFFRRLVLYMTGDFAGLEAHTVGDNTPGARLARFQALIEQGRIDEALKSRPPPSDEVPSEAAHNGLIMVLAWTAQGYPSKASEWIEQSAKAMEAAHSDWERTLALLRRPGPPTDAELNELTLPPASKAVLLALLGQRYPGRRAELFAAARQFNVEREFPYHLVRRATTTTAAP